MLSRTVLNIVRKSFYSNARTLCCARDFLRPNFLSNDDSVREHNVQNCCKLYVTKRFKSKRKKVVDTKREDEDSDEEKDDTEEAPVGSKVATVNVQTRRLDAIAKFGFGMSRSKIEEMFYASRIRVNGNKVLKKSMELEVGDEVDLILHRSENNSAFLVVHRCVILSMNPTAHDSIRIQLSKEKNLLIEDYEVSWSSEF